LGLSALEGGVVKACQSRVLSDVGLEVDDVPDVTTGGGTLIELIERSTDVVELGIRPDSAVPYLPGQYFRFRFRGYPCRCFSPTGAMESDGEDGDDQLLRLHIRRVPDGRISSELGETIKAGHRLRILGPFGSAYWRPGQSNRLVLVASGTGFAPIYSVALAALKERPDREMVLVVGARSLESLYMIPALCGLAKYPNVTIVPTTKQRHAATTAIKHGAPQDWLPALDARDIVYVAGSPQLVDQVGECAKRAGAECHADPFMPATGGLSLLSMTSNWWRGNAARVIPLRAGR
jgi:3-phenylpropionate/trans-cinnamate dioxygenase ferredoxin reductase subunit